MTPAYLPMSGDRNIALNQEIAFIGDNFTGATFRMQLRLTPDAPGTPLATATMTLLYGGTDTLANFVRLTQIPQSLAEAAVASGDYTMDTVTGLSLVKLSIPAAAMALAQWPAPELGDDLILAYDLLVTPTGEPEVKIAYGPFTVRGTVTR